MSGTADPAGQTTRKYVNLTKLGVGDISVARAVVRCRISQGQLMVPLLAPDARPAAPRSCGPAASSLPQAQSPAPAPWPRVTFQEFRALVPELELTQAAMQDNLDRLVVGRNHRIPLAGSVRRCRMREGISIEVSAADRERLAAVVADRNSPQKHVWRARIILATAEGCGTAEIMRRAGVSKPCVWRWQERFMREGVAGLLHDKTRKPGLPPTPPAVIDRVVELTFAEPPGETTHWTGRAMAAVSGISLRSVQRIWAAHGLQPHRVRRFKLSQDPAFAAKLRDVVGLYLDPPAHSLVLSVDEKSQIQSLPLARTGALDRTQPGLPMKKGRAGTMTHDYSETARRRCSRRSMFSMARSSANAWRATATRNSSVFSTRVEAVVPAGKTGPRDSRQLRRSQTSQGPRLARSSPTLDVSLHPDLVLLGQCR